MLRFTTRSLGFTLALVAAVTVSSIAHAAADTPMSAGGKALARLDDDWSKAAIARNVDKVASFYAADCMAYPPNAPASVGAAAAKAVWASYFADSSFTISWTTTHADVAKSGDLGYTTGTYQDSYKGPDGKMVNEVGKYVCVWAKQKDGSWKAVHDIWNSDTK
jgi:ketosteroid isomerase-like protein